jgi:hypothetical protein
VHVHALFLKRTLCCGFQNDVTLPPLWQAETHESATESPEGGKGKENQEGKC